jgi:hypothetical protein
VGSLHLLASWAHAKDRHGGSKGFVLEEICGSIRGKKGGHKAKQWRRKINRASKGVIVNIRVEEYRGSHGHKERREQEASRRKIKAKGIGGRLPAGLASSHGPRCYPLPGK